ncbi:HpcH/HpaI aldolase/citrate lyase family protein [Agrococcus jejuensis]|uniref:Citrate lyase subunit beta / citryl-CoA lyase n=1 Tax=Agrococcus jejuensis TaxID=399736 RepID=A0A1G8GWY1_9MICO|nr:CoA ester lyase [Agrococcus jejuensis]SDH98894.1 citrate lyase subunit beta / citryl-CoA lyase [Agrococcus jejuensis]
MTVALYVPGDRADRFAKAVATGADVVILDLEDAVAADAKDAARSAVDAWLREHGPTGLQVRVSAGSSEDLAMLARHDVAVRLPKVRGAADVDAVVDRLDRSRRFVHALVEDAAGLSALDEIARHPAVASLAIGEADLRADLGATSPAMLQHARILLVVAARAAGLPAPLMAAYPDIRDFDGLAADCRAGAALGFGGRTAIHPSQVDRIRAAFAPTDAEVAWARDTLAALGDAGVATLADGQMVDEAMARRARATLARLPRDERTADG